MARSIVAAVAQIKSELARVLAPDFIRQVCRDVGHVWRERILDPVTTVHLFALQVLHGNTACAHVPRLGAVDCTGEAYVQARQRLPVSVLQRVLDAMREHLLGSPTLDDGRWRGHRTFLVDGTGVSMPDTPALQKAFGQPGGQKPGVSRCRSSASASSTRCAGWRRRCVARSRWGAGRGLRWLGGEGGGVSTER